MPPRALPMADTGKGLLSSSDDDDEDPAALEAAQRLMEVSDGTKDWRQQYKPLKQVALCVQSTPTIQQARPAQVDGAAQPGQQVRPERPSLRLTATLRPDAFSLRIDRRRRLRWMKVCAPSHFLTFV